MSESYFSTFKPNEPWRNYENQRNAVMNYLDSGKNENSYYVQQSSYVDEKGVRHEDLGKIGVNRLRDVFSDLVNGIRDTSSNSARTAVNAVQEIFNGSSNYNGSSSRGSSNGSGSGSVLDYYNAPLATRYGMDAATAYQEALANTSHQREVLDLQAAGLNPILSTRYGGSAGVSGATVLATSSGGSGGSGTEEGDFKINPGKVAQIAGTVAGVLLAAKTGRISNITQGANAGKTIASLFN